MIFRIANRRMIAEPLNLTPRTELTEAEGAMCMHLGSALMQSRQFCEAMTAEQLGTDGQAWLDLSAKILRMLPKP